MSTFSEKYNVLEIKSLEASQIGGGLTSFKIRTADYKCIPHALLTVGRKLTAFLLF